jgi:hypothetical protein
MTFSRPAAHDDVSAVMAEVAALAFLQNQMSSCCYLIGWTGIVLAGEGWR